VDGHKPVRLAKGDFALMPANPGFTIASDLACAVVSIDAQEAPACQAGEVRYGDPDLEADFKQLGGYFQLDSVNRSLLSGLLPTRGTAQAHDRLDYDFFGRGVEHGAPLMAGNSAGVASPFRSVWCSRPFRPNR
jgi:hypothetical protein